MIPWLNQCIQLAIPEKDIGLMELDITTVEQWFDWMIQEDNSPSLIVADFSNADSIYANQKPFSLKEWHFHNETNIMFGCNTCVRMHGWLAQIIVRIQRSSKFV